MEGTSEGRRKESKPFTTKIRKHKDSDAGEEAEDGLRTRGPSLPALSRHAEHLEVMLLSDAAGHRRTDTADATYIRHSEEASAQEQKAAGGAGSECLQGSFHSRRKAAEGVGPHSALCLSPTVGSGLRAGCCVTTTRGRGKEGGPESVSTHSV